VQFLEPKNSQNGGGQRSQNNEFQDYGQGFGGQQSGQNTSYNNNSSKSNSNQSDNPFANANGPIDISDDDLPF
ncbi:single-stranded DNA-binding protein, partial [Bacillus sp. JR_15]